MEIEVISDTEICGHKKTTYWAFDQYINFYAKFSKPFSYTLVTSPETAKYYGFVSAGIGLLFLAATVSIQLFFKGDNGEKPLLKITSDDRVSFFGTAALYAILTIVIYCGIV